MDRSFDIVVVGAGHAGAEAAFAAARLGRRVAMVTLRAAHVGRLSCNPAVGGLAKGNLVREIDALGGLMASVADLATIQFRRLNTRKGLAVQASRAQVDIDRYPAELARALRETEGLTLIEGEVAQVHAGPRGVEGVTLGDGSRVTCRAVVLTTGTFLSGLMHCGPRQTHGGRIGDSAASRLSASLRALGLRLGRLKTGTTPRIDARTVAWDRVEVQSDVEPAGHFSFTPPARRLPQRDCHITYTSEATHEIIRANLHRSPMYSGTITGRGPRYCPSIEDKIVRFADKERHQLFLEPEGLDTPRIYVNGLSTSLPEDVQEAVVRSVAGLEQAHILQHGYAVEYDFSDPRDLDHALQHKAVPGLYLAGQVNGTSGYEEAAAQGVMAGINAARALDDRPPVILARDEAYIGVLIDDLVTRGVGGEPYRMFPSRAEHRLCLREDNADRRLTPLGREIGLVSDERWNLFEYKLSNIERLQTWAEQTSVRPDTALVARFEGLGLTPPRNRASVAELLRRPDVGWAELARLLDEVPEASPEVTEQVETDLKYAGYLRREASRAEAARRLEHLALPAELDYRLPGLSNEVGERLRAHRPATLGAAARLPGITPAAIDTLAVYLARATATAP